MTPATRLFIACLASATLTGCAQTVAEPESVRLGRELRAAIGPASCTADAHCRSLPVGAKACGGPAGFLAWSSQSGDARRIAELAARQAEAERREIEASGLRSNCALVTDPGVACEAGRCQVRPAAGPRSGAP